MSNVASGRMVSEDGTVVNVADTLNGVEVNAKVNVNSFGAKSGRMLDEDGNVVNIADVIGGVETGKRVNIESYSPSSGNFIREDGKVVNVTKALVEKLSGGGSGGGGGETTEPGKPYIDTSKITDFSYFCYSGARTETIDRLDTSNGTNFSNMFYKCSSLTTVPLLDISNGTNFNSMFQSCSSLTTVPLLDISNGTNFNSMFQNCSSLTSVALTTAKSNMAGNSFSACLALTDLTIGEGWAVNIYLHYLNNLTVESLHGMIENLADLTGQTAKIFQIGATNIAKIDEAHIDMLESKNWDYS